MLAVTLTVDQMRELMREAAAEAVAKIPAQKEVLTTEEAAQVLQVHPKSLLKFIDEHKIPVHWVASERRFRRSELLEWLGKTKQPKQPKPKEVA